MGQPTLDQQAAWERTRLLTIDLVEQLVFPAVHSGRADDSGVWEGITYDLFTYRFGMIER